ncbi:hypothetical protein [Actinotalea subterranea]|uniref:variant leucine-rich repeat-containing protein n=1 Tax=Actinotalea subterranea TaxID=2607497 RepID=UPI0011EDC034|nr:hypothetical protein [Actinotalea subterranea]
MSQEDSYTSAQASDPTTSPQVLADIAALRPDLRAAVAANPSAYPGLLEWLGGLGEPAVDAAIAARPEAPSAPQAPDAPQTAETPQWQSEPTAPQAPQWQAPTAQQPAWQGQQPAWQGQQPAWQGQQPQQAAPGFGTPPPGPQGFAGGAPAYQAPGQAPAGPGQPYAGQPYGYQGGPGAPAPKKSSKTALWIVLGVVGLVVVLGVAGIFVVRGLLDKVGSYGSDAALDELYDACADEDWAACDDLYNQSPLDSEYEEFGFSCGGRSDQDILCTEQFGAAGTDEGTTDTGDTGEDTGEDTGTDTGASEGTYGSDPELDALYDACADGDNQACDDLYMESGFGTEYEEFGDTCGGRGRDAGQLFCNE